MNPTKILGVKKLETAMNRRPMLSFYRNGGHSKVLPEFYLMRVEDRGGIQGWDKRAMNKISNMVTPEWSTTIDDDWQRWRKLRLISRYTYRQRLMALVQVK